MQKVDSGGTFNYVCDGTTPGSNVLKDGSAVYTPGLSERRGSASKFYHSDALGSTRGITNSSQTVTDSVLYDAFGMTVSRTGTTPTPFGFVGKEQYQTDNDSGLMLLGHRYYDASVGRFISSDPAKAGDNWYAYCSNNALKAVDSTGLCLIPLHTFTLPDPGIDWGGAVKSIAQTWWKGVCVIGTALAAFGEYASGQGTPMDGPINEATDGDGNPWVDHNGVYIPDPLADGKCVHEASAIQTELVTSGQGLGQRIGVRPPEGMEYFPGSKFDYHEVVQHPAGGVIDTWKVGSKQPMPYEDWINMYPPGTRVTPIGEGASGVR